jgi:hypothetical protein
MMYRPKPMLGALPDQAQARRSVSFRTSLFIRMHPFDWSKISQVNASD